jgi:hypothetical protein
MFDNYRHKTDNLVFPNTEEGWKKLGWKLHFMTGRSLTMILHLHVLEHKARKNAEKSNTSDQDDIP